MQKRFTLSFNFNNEDAVKAYHLIENQQNSKSSYIIKAVLAFEKQEEILTKEMLEEIISKLLKEYKFSDDDKKDDKIDDQMLDLYMV